MHPCWDGLWRGGPKGLVGASKYWMAFGGVVQRALLVHPSIGWPLEGWSKGLGSCIQVLDGLWGGDPKDHDSASKYWMALGLMDQRRGFEASKYWIAHPRQPRPTQGNPSPPKATQAHPRQPKPTRGDPSQPKATQAHPRQPKPTQGNPSPPKATQAHPRQPKPTQGNPSPPKATRAWA